MKRISQDIFDRITPEASLQRLDVVELEERMELRIGISTHISSMEPARAAASGFSFYHSDHPFSMKLGPSTP